MIELHEFDPATGYCKHCGAKFDAIYKHRRWRCYGGGNVVGISHKIAWRKAKAEAKGGKHP